LPPKASLVAITSFAIMIALIAVGNPE